MNSLRQMLFRTLLCLITMGAYGQKHTEKFNEVFTVAKDAVLEINTSHADIAFETWGKDQVVIEATIEIEGATAQERAQYFKDAGFQIFGNSKNVSIKTGSEHGWYDKYGISDLQNFNINIPDFSEMQFFNFDEDFDFDFKDIIEMPVLPIKAASKFDYEAFQKEGNAYLMRWQSAFENDVDEEHAEALEAWSKAWEKRQEAKQKGLEKRAGKQDSLHHRRAEAFSARAESSAAHSERRAEAIRAYHSNGASDDSIRVFYLNSDARPNVFYKSLKGEKSNYKVKKTIKIKMPKGMKIKMNVRHGEVKLAENTKNINATLSHSNLLATTIDGENTNIKVSYSPVSVQQWNYGHLQANYSEKVILNKVLHLRLNATSSDVTIGSLVHSAFIKNDLGPLKINAIAAGFDELDVSMQHAELSCNTPETPFTLYVNGTSSTLSSPDRISLQQTKNGSASISKGYCGNKNAKSTIMVHAKNSTVALQ